MPLVSAIRLPPADAPPVHQPVVVAAQRSQIRQPVIPILAPLHDVVWVIGPQSASWPLAPMQKLSGSASGICAWSYPSSALIKRRFYAT